jgi:hypothetical protein
MAARNLALLCACLAVGVMLAQFAALAKLSSLRLVLMWCGTVLALLLWSQIPRAVNAVIYGWDATLGQVGSVWSVCLPTAIAILSIALSRI